MTTHIHKLEGCAPTPLAHYLKALAILRLLAEQSDPTARGWWRDEAFWLATRLSREELCDFFLTEYRPTPILSPWNAGSGFYYQDDAALSPLEASTAPRFAPFREGISLARRMSQPLAEILDRLKAAEDAAKKAGRRDDPTVKQTRQEKDRLKDSLLAACRREWTDELLPWFDAALALAADGGAAWPALLGSGGNDGRLDFTNNSMLHIGTLFDLHDPGGAARPSAAPLLRAALYGQPTPGLSRRAVGQFHPGGAGGDNMSAGFTGESLVNPWDFVLMLEGATVFVSSITRSSDLAALPQAAAPFAVRPSGAGYGSAAAADETPRGEQWMPLWRQPALLTEVKRLFLEGRTRIGRKTSARAIDAARAISSLGVARGVDSFQRFGFIERNGQANLAVPLGRWRVTSAPNLGLLDDIDVWCWRLRSAARDPQAPKSIVSAVREMDESLLAVLRVPDTRRWQRMLIALGQAERALCANPSFAGDAQRALTPLSPLRAEWLHKVDDGSAEFRLAAALAGQEVLLPYGRMKGVLNVRAHYMPLDRTRAARYLQAPRPDARFAMGDRGLIDDSDVVCSGRDLIRDCIALLRRRVQLSAKAQWSGFGMWGTTGVEASLSDIMAFLSGALDDALILALARPLMAIRWWQSDLPAFEEPAPSGIDAPYAVARLAYSPVALDRGGTPVSIPLDPEPIARLISGDLHRALSLCLGRLSASGFAPVVTVFAGEADRAHRLLASLVFPLRRVDLYRCLRLVTKPFQSEDSHGS